MSSAVMIFLSIGLVSYFAITSILDNKIKVGAESNLRQIQLALQSNLSDLNHVSQQMGNQGVVGADLDHYLSAGDPFEKSILLTNMKTNLNTITFTNPGTGLVMYYFSQDHTFMLENGPARWRQSLGHIV
ncbi:MAG: hypothetical protein ABIU06_00365 [Anaerolineales bacterium]